MADSKLKDPFATKSTDYFIHGNLYKFEKVLKGVRQYHCSLYGIKQKNCFARMTMNRDGVITETGRHTHNDDFSRERMSLFKSELEATAATEIGKLSRIYTKVAQKYADVACHTNFFSVKSRMYRARNKMKKIRCNKIKSLQEFAKFLQSPEGQGAFEYTHPDNELEYKLTHAVITDKNGFPHIILRNQALLEKLQYGTVSNVDGTFGSRPKFSDCSQLLTVMVRIGNKSFPCIWVLMSSRKKEAYEAIFNQIKGFWPDWAPEDFHSDFEQGLMDSLEKCFDKCRVIGCFFHFTQALLRNAIRLKAAVHQNAKKQPQKHKYILRTMALALLPEADIRDAFLQIVKDANNEFPNYFTDFFDYFESYWLDRRGERTFCVYGCYIRTNNSIESYHRDLHDQMRSRPTVWNFIDTLLVFQGEILLKLEHEQTEFTRIKKRRLTAENDKIINEYWKKLREGQVDANTFIREVSEKLQHGKFSEELVKIDEDEPDKELEEENVSDDEN